MDRDKAIEAIKENQSSSDIEMEHARADAILCELLDSLGYGDVVDEYKKVKKWYA